MIFHKVCNDWYIEGNYIGMNVLVIGNGFDLAHGLPTRYMDFLEFIEKYKEYYDDSLIDSDFTNITVYFKNLKENRSDIYNEINNLINENRWIHHFLMLKDKNLLENKQTWIDFESEISKVVKVFETVKKRFNNNSYSEFNVVRLNDYEFEILHYVLEDGIELSVMDCIFTLGQIEAYIKKLEYDLERLIRSLEIYLNHYVKLNYSNALNKIDFINKLKVDYVLTFNYTSTYECVYDTSKVKFDYIHGKANVEHDLSACNLVLGIDEYLNTDERNKNVEFIRFKKFYQRIYKGTGCLYKDWISFYLEQKVKNYNSQRKLNLYFIGHSLDVTDKDILKELILCEGANTTIYYHNQEALGRMITNLVKVIGEDELIRRTGGSNASIKFIQQPEE